MDTLTIVLMLAAIGAIVYHYYKQYKAMQDAADIATWPVKTPSCPDYWVHEGNNVCKNVFNVGSCPKDGSGLPIPKGVVDFGQKRFQGKEGKYEKCRWAKKCQASWEGIDKECD